MIVSFITVFFKFNLISPSILIISDGLTSVDPSRTSFKVEKLDFFDPELPIEYGLKNVIKINKNTIYRNVHLFVQRITDIANIKDDKIVNYNLLLYL